MQATAPKILLLDDELQNLAVLEVLLRSLASPQGLELASFTSPVEALAWCERHEPDLCLVDYRMPEMNGIEFLARIRRLSGFGSVPVVMITGVAEKAVRREALIAGAVDFITKPFEVDELRLRLRNLLALRRERSASVQAVEWLAQAPVPLDRETADREHELIIEKLARLSCSRDEETGNHMRRVAHIARLVARELGMEASFREMLFVAAPMHDVGKVGIPDRILLKRGRLDAAEWEIMKTHTQIGYDLLKDSRSPLLRVGADIALAHHEKYDGSGYPRGLKGEGIPAAGRIVAVADGLDALLSVRPYKQAWTPAEAFAYVRSERGRHFDPGCVDVLLRHADEVLAIEREYADEARDHAHDYDRVLPRAG